MLIAEFTGEAEFVTVGSKEGEEERGERIYKRERLQTRLLRGRGNDLPSAGCLRVRVSHTWPRTAVARSFHCNSHFFLPSSRDRLAHACIALHILRRGGCSTNGGEGEGRVVGGGGEGGRRGEPPFR